MYKRLLLITLAFTACVGIAGASTLKINFQSAGAPIPEGYLPDYGDAYGDRGNGFFYGWDEEMRADARDRNNGSAPDQRYDTLNHLQKSGDAVWEIELPNGTYDIYMVCGDPSHTDQIDNFDVEGTVVEDPDGEDNYDEYQLTVELTDGRLTIMPAEGADNCKICFVELTSDALTQFFAAARNPDPEDGLVGFSVPLFQWTAGDTAVFHDLYLGTSPELTADDLVGPGLRVPIYYHAPGLDTGTTYYWRVDEIELDGTRHEGEVWSFVTISEIAWLPDPVDGAVDVLPDTNLTWETGMASVPLTHALYFGESFDDVNEGTADADKGILEEPGYDPGVLNADTTYYWRVDQIEPDGTIRRGDVWSFDTVAAGPGKIIREWWFDISGATVASLTANSRYPDDPDGSEFVSLMQNPPNWAEQYGVRMRGWLFIPETGNYTFSIEAEDEGEIRLSPDEDPANAVMIASTAGDAQSPPQSLEAGQRYYIEALMKENTIGDNLTVSWQGPGIPMQVISADYVGATPFLPVRAYSPAPVDGAAGVPQSPTCGWEAGVNAAQHDVYFGADANAVAEADTTTAGIYRGRQATTSYTPGELEWDVTYYWRVDEFNADGSITAGRLWSFTTADYILVDDFEGYTNEVGERIFQVWIDGIGYNEPAPGSPGNDTGALVGHDVWSADSPYYQGDIVEVVDVHGGNQAMPLYYDNSTAPFYSEAERTYAAAQNWTQNDVNTLRLFFKGQPAGFVESPSGVITMSGEGADIWGLTDEFRFAYKTLNGNGSIVARVDSLVDPDAWTKVGVMIRQTTDPSSAFAAVYMTGNNGIRYQARLRNMLDAISDSSVATPEQIAMREPNWVKIERVGNDFNGYYSTDGVTWTAMVWNPQTINMTGNALIGLAVCSHSTGNAAIAEFSGVQTTGASGAWQVEEIGVVHPANDQDDLYVALEDSQGHVAAVPYPDGTTVPQWTRWDIPLADFVGVNAASIRKVYIGVGNREAATPGQIGAPFVGNMVLIDDIRVLEPEPVEPNEPATE